MPPAPPPGSFKPPKQPAAADAAGAVAAGAVSAVSGAGLDSGGGGEKDANARAVAEARIEAHLGQQARRMPVRCFFLVYLIVK